MCAGVLPVIVPVLSFDSVGYEFLHVTLRKSVRSLYFYDKDVLCHGLVSFRVEEGLFLQNIKYLLFNRCVRVAAVIR